MASPSYSDTHASPSTIGLVVCSDHTFAATVASILPDWKIERACDNAAALTLLESRPFDLVLTSADTSGQDDVNLLRRIRLVRPHTRLIILTNERSPADVIASMRARAFSYFSKPLSWAMFTEMIRLSAEEPCWDDGIEVLSATPDWIRIAVRCDVKTADRLPQFCREIADLPDGEKGDVAHALREMLLNAVVHGGRFDPHRYVEVSYLRARHMVLCRLKDPGEGFSLDEIRHAAIANPPDDPIRQHSHRDELVLRQGGFAVLVGHRLVDEVIYGGKGNEVVLVKYLDSYAQRTA